MGADPECNVFEAEFPFNGGTGVVVYCREGTSAKDKELHYLKNYFLPRMDEKEKRWGQSGDARQTSFILDGARPTLEAIEELKEEFKKRGILVADSAGGTTSEHKLLDLANNFRWSKGTQKQLDRGKQDEKAYREALAAVERAPDAPFNPLRVSLVTDGNVLACVPPCTRDSRRNEWLRTTLS